MIISKTPLRMSLLGGGSDMAVFYKEYGGAVVSTSIDKYIYVTINKKFDNELRVSYSKTENVCSTNLIEHKLIKECLNFFKITGGLEITTIADIPSNGTGLGSSSSFTVALLHCLNAYEGKFISKEKLSQDACEIEINICKEPIGKQDQYAASYGGLNLYEFKTDDTVIVSPIIIKKESLYKLNNSLMLFYTGLNRSASLLLKKQNDILSENKSKQQIMNRMVELAYSTRIALEGNDLDSFGELLNEGWILKKSLLDEISNTQIDNWYNKAILNGAIGGKILGAGAGGFLLLYAPVNRHEEIKSALSELKLVNFKFDNQGSQIIFYQPQ
jgi:D-glycero-alpha-D-manno-heptose-7-phosphate kinase